MKSTFRRQLTLITLLLSLSLLVTGIVSYRLLDQRLTEEEERKLANTAESVAILVDAYSSSFFAAWDFRTNLSVAAAASNRDILICSPTGEVKVCANDKQSCRHLQRSLPTNTATGIFSGLQTANAAAGRIYGDERIAVALPVTYADGTPLCIILVSTEANAISQTSEKFLQFFALIALAVLLLALITAPFFTRREARPIQEMAMAARSIAHGNFTTRVPTGHRNEELEELAVAFNNMTVSLQHAEIVRQEFVANVSHELKTPMTTISGYLDGMLDGTIPTEKQPQYMELVSTEVRRLSRLVRNMLDVSRLRDQGIPADRMSDFDICESAGQALLSFEQRINRKDLNVDIDMPELGLTVHAAADLVTQVLYNLLDNAVKFVDEGGTLSIRIQRQGPRAVITVGNTGPTIPPMELPLLFDRFHKTDKSRSTDRDGVGLGLYIVKTIVLAHGEDVYVTSHNNYTSFTFTLRAK